MDISEPNSWQSGSIFTGIDDEQRARMQSMQSCRFSHSLANSPLLDMDAVRQIARALLDQGRFDQIYYTTGRPESDGVYSDAQRRREVLDTLDALGSEKAWIRLTRVDEVFPELRRIVEQFHADLSALYGFEVGPLVSKTLTTLFVSSPRAVTPYHMDHTWNFLLQISGRKTVYLFDPNDPRVVSQQMRESFYIGNQLIKRNPEGGDGIAFDLPPGFCVHHPVNAPHWVQNGPESSVSLSLGMALHDTNRTAKIHQVNFYLRRFGLQPAAPGANRMGDALKAGFVQLFSDRRPQSFDEILYSGLHRLRALSRGRFA